MIASISGWPAWKMTRALVLASRAFRVNVSRRACGMDMTTAPGMEARYPALRGLQTDLIRPQRRMLGT
jgi:hypothetical protein